MKKTKSRYFYLKKRNKLKKDIVKVTSKLENKNKDFKKNKIYQNNIFYKKNVVSLHCN